MAPPHPSEPGLEELAALAARALAWIDDDGQVQALWERRVGGRGAADRLLVTVTVRADGRGGRAATEIVGDGQLRRAARQASLRARQGRAWPAPPLPQPEQGASAGEQRADLDGLDGPALAEAARAAVGTGLDVEVGAGLARHAVASTAGVRAAEERSHVCLRVRGRRRDDGWETSAEVAAAQWWPRDAQGAGPGGAAKAVNAAEAGDAAAALAAAASEVRGLVGDDRVGGPFGVGVAADAPLVDVPRNDQDPVVVLGPAAVAVALEQLRAAAGVDAAMGAGPFSGHRKQVAADVVGLSDDAQSAATLRRRFDAEGVPRRRVALIEAGVAVGRVLDQAAAVRLGAWSTGHATQALTLAPFPDHLALGAGRAASLAALVEPVRRGLLLPCLPAAFMPADGGRRHGVTSGLLVEDGRVVARLRPFKVDVATPALLAAVADLTAPRRLVPWRGHAPGGIGAALVPGVRASGGVRVVA